MKLKFFLTLLLFAVALRSSAAEIAVTEKPNILFFIADDHGQSDSPVYGAKDVRTPNLEQLANEGLVFTHAFVASPSCGPSRSALLTGLMPARNGAEPNHTVKRDGVRSLPERLRDLGYETAAFGKVAHSGPDAPRHGFDKIGPGKPDAVTRFLKERDATKPLCLCVGTHWPHVAWPENSGYDPSQVTLPPTFVDTAETREARTQYYTAVSLADREFGAFRDLVRSKLGANTLIIYSADHGAQWPFGKWNLYDASLRVPLIVSWPGVIQPKSRSDALVQWTDLFPTFIELAGGKAAQDIDGRSFAPVLLGKTTVHRSEIFATHSGDGGMNVYPIRALRMDDFKFIRNLHPEFAYTSHIDKARKVDGLGYWITWHALAQSGHSQAEATVNRYHERPNEELYDLKNDPFEMHNLATNPQHADRLSAMRAKLENWMETQGDRRTVFNKPRLLSDPESTRPGASVGTRSPKRPQ
jgi:N-sulfoglucosamine sulfohydrolase